MALATAAALALAGPPGARAAGPTPEEAAAQLCQQAKVMFGSQFEVLFGSQAGCEAKTLPIVNAAIAKCGDDQACLQSEIQRELMELALGGGGENVATTQILAQACSQLQAKLGKRFAKAFGSVAGCKEKIKPDIDKLIADAAASCTARGVGPGVQESCILETAASAEAAFVAKYAAGLSADVIAVEVADEVCGRLQTELGDRFAKKYGSLDGCKTEIKAKAAPLAKDAAAKCQSAANQEACITEQIDATTGTLSEALGLGPSASDLVDEIGAEVCARLQTELGDRFAKKYGSLDGCKTQIKAKATPVATAAIAKCQKATDKQACVTEQVNAVTDTLSSSLGAGPTLSDITDELAEQACTRLKTELGDRFAKKYGSADGCLKQVKAASETFAAGALAKCAAASDRAACTRTAIEAGTASLQDALGAGPSADEVAGEVGDQACARIKSELGDRFAKKYPSLAACKTAVQGEAAADIKAALAKCQKAADVTACAEQSMADISDRLTTKLAGPTEDDVVAEVVDQACTKIRAQVDAKEFAARFGDARGCANLILKDAVKVAQQGLAACKKAADREGCVAKVATDGTQALTTRFGGAALDATGLADRLATQTCQAVQAKLSPSDFAKVFTSLAGCKGRVSFKATAAAGEAVRTCGAVEPAQRVACAETQLRAAGATLEADLRLATKVLPSQVTAVAGQIADRACQAAAAELGSLLSGGVAGCKSRAAGDAGAIAYAALDTCNGVEACVRKAVEGKAEELRRRLFPMPADPTLDSLAFDIGRSACVQTYTAVQSDRTLSSIFDGKYQGRVSNCVKTFEAPALAAARGVAVACRLSTRPADARQACYRRGSEGASKALGGSIMQLLKAAAPPKKR